MTSAQHPMNWLKITMHQGKHDGWKQKSGQSRLNWSLKNIILNNNGWNYFFIILMKFFSFLFFLILSSAWINRRGALKTLAEKRGKKRMPLGKIYFPETILSIRYFSDTLVWTTCHFGRGEWGGAVYTSELNNYVNKIHTVFVEQGLISGKASGHNSCHAVSKE